MPSLNLFTAMLTLTIDKVKDLLSKKEVDYKKMDFSKWTEHLAHFGCEFVLGLGTAFLESLNKDDARLERVERLLSSLVREPFRTAVSQINEANKIMPSDISEMNYKEDRFRDALANLDRALSLANEEDMPAIYLLKSFVCLNIRGGYQESRSNMISLKNYIDKEIISVNNEIQQSLDEKEYIQAKLSKLKTENVNFGGVGGGLLGMDISQELIQYKLTKSQFRDIGTQIQNLEAKLENSKMLSQAIADNI